MNDAAPPPPPFPTPPSIEEAADEHLSVVRAVRNLQREITSQRNEISAQRREIDQLRTDVGRALDVGTAARLLLGRLAKHLGLPDA